MLLLVELIDITSIIHLYDVVMSAFDTSKYCKTSDQNFLFQFEPSLTVADALKQIVAKVPDAVPQKSKLILVISDSLYLC